MSFDQPGYLALLALAPLAAGAYVALAGWRRRAAARFAPGRDATTLAVGVQPGLRMGKAALFVLAIAALAVAMARPQIGAREVVVEQAGADVVIALDVSRSMHATDVEPDRLTRAQDGVFALLDRLRGHRVGLVLFADGALLRAPLTTDVSVVQALVRSARADAALLAPGSDIGAALRAATAAVEAGESGSRAIVLVSDGEDHAGAALAAAREAAARGVEVFAVGVGSTTGAVILSRADADEAVPPVVTRLDEELLRLIAASSPRGAYVAGPDLAGLGGPLGQLDGAVFAATRETLPAERFQWLVLAAIVLLAAEFLLPDRLGLHRPRLKLGMLRPAGLTAGLVLLAVASAGCSSASDGLVEDGNDAYARDEFEAALEAYRRAAVEEPGRPEPRVNAGLALHQLGRYEDAALETLRALPIDDVEDAAVARYNLGNHYVLLGRLDEALGAYREALLLDPDDGDAKHNLELVLRLLTAASTDGATTDGPADGDADVDADPRPDAAADGGLSPARAAVLRTLEEALAGIEDEFTIEEALRALDAAQELNRLLPLVQPSGGAGAPDRPDY